MPYKMHSKATRNCALLVGLLLVLAGWMVGCDGGGGLPSGVVPATELRYVGSSACGSCHAGVFTTHSRTGHSQALKPVLGGVPTYPTNAPGVPTPPAGFNWTDLSYVIDGYDKTARFVGADGYVLANGTAGTNTQYNLAHPAIGLPAAQFLAYLPSQATPLPFSLDMFERRTTGPQSLADNGGLHQENRVGIEGTWAEAGVQCEACHGPGSLHVPNPSAGNINLGADSSACNRCHSSGDAQTIEAAANLIAGFQQSDELASSPHAGFSCTTCHDPHVSVIADQPNAIRNACTTCHPDQNMALHRGLVYQRGDYSEVLTCESCHMPYAVETMLRNQIDLANGLSVVLGDTRSHIFRLDPSLDLSVMFNVGSTEVVRNAQGAAALSTCVVCQRCHNGLGNAFAFPAGAGCNLGGGIHGSEP